jgi:hypothetical protein
MQHIPNRLLWSIYSIAFMMFALFSERVTAQPPVSNPNSIKLTIQCVRMWIDTCASVPQNIQFNLEYGSEGSETSPGQAGSMSLRAGESQSLPVLTQFDYLKVVPTGPSVSAGVTPDIDFEQPRRIFIGRAQLEYYFDIPGHEPFKGTLQLTTNAVAAITEKRGEEAILNFSSGTAQTIVIPRPPYKTIEITLERLWTNNSTTNPPSVDIEISFLNESASKVMQGPAIITLSDSHKKASVSITAAIQKVRIKAIGPSYSARIDNEIDQAQNIHFSANAQLNLAISGEIPRPITIKSVDVSARNIPLGQNAQVSFGTAPPQEILVQ